MFGTWTLVSSGKALWTGTGSNGNTTIAASLPKIEGTATTTTIYNNTRNEGGTSGPITMTQNGTIALSSGSGKQGLYTMSFKASDSNSVYSGTSNTVQPPAYVVNVWRRTA